MIANNSPLISFRKNMSLTGTAEYEQEVNSPGDVFFQIFGRKKESLPKICPNNVPLIDLVKGKWGEPGCVILVHYLLDGKEIISEETIEAVDEEKKSITYKIYEGELMKLYKKLRITFQVQETISCPANGKNLVKWIYEYEKQNSEVPSPHNMKDFAFEVTQTVDQHYMMNPII